MTTVAFDGETMAADTQISSGDLYSYNVTKIKRLHGYIIGCCGDLDMLHWFHNAFVPDVVTKYKTFKLQLPHTASSISFEAMIVAPTGKVFLVSDCLLVTPVKTFGYAAIGSGSAVALGALCVGANAAEAVKAAIKHSSGSGGKVMTVPINPKRRKK